MHIVGPAAIVDAIKDNGAPSSINLLKNAIPVEQAQELVKIMQANENLTSLCGLSREETELDFSGQNLGAGDVVLIANEISNMGAILSVNFLKTKIGVVQAKALASILKEHPTLKSLCGNSGEETELDMSDKAMYAGHGIMLVPEIADNGALIKLDIRGGNLIGAEQEEDLQRICVASGIELAK
jgi:hypothetical protein